MRGGIAKLCFSKGFHCLNQWQMGRTVETTEQFPIPWNLRCSAICCIWCIFVTYEGFLFELVSMLLRRQIDIVKIIKSALRSPKMEMKSRVLGLTCTCTVPSPQGRQEPGLPGSQIGAGTLALPFASCKGYRSLGRKITRFNSTSKVRAEID